MKTERKPPKNNKGLQKLTESEDKINSVLALKKITPEDIKSFSNEERIEFSQIIQTRYNQSKGDERELFYEKIEAIIVEETKREIWETNHGNIIWAITVLIKEKGRMPTKTEIALKTDLSRQTIYKHLKDYGNNPLYLEYQEQFKFMKSKVLAKVFQFAVNGDIKACRLYLECIGALKNTSSGNKAGSINNTLIQNQNNFIQIGGTILNQEIIKQMTPEQISVIEGVLKNIQNRD